MKPKRIVIGVDFSDGSIAAALWTAFHFAPKAEVILVHAIVIPQPPVFLEGRFPSRDLLMDTARSGASTRLSALAEKIGTGRARINVRTGDAAEEIDRAVRENRADLIVIGKHGMRSGGWGGLGSTAQHLARCSSVPVLLASGMRDAPPARLLAAVAEDDVSEWVLGWTRGLAERFGARVTIIHAVSHAVLSHMLSTVPQGHPAGSEAPDDPEIQEEFRMDADRWLRRFAAERVPVDHTDYVTAFGHPAEQILAAATRLDSDLIMLGNRHRGIVRRKLLGSVVAEVLHRATRPVLVVSEPEDTLA